jgi:hypothetical protein
MSLGTQAKPSGKLLDYEQFIDHQIQRTRRRIKVTDIITASLTLLVAFLAVLFLEVIFDHVFGLPLLLRRIVLATGMTSACLFAAMRVAMPFVRRINGIYAARTIENADATFKNSLINYLELRRQRGQVSKAIMATLESRAVSDLAHVEVDTVVNQQRLMRTFYALSGVIVVFCLYAAFAPKSILDSTRRAFLADLTRPTNTRLANIKPGNDPELSQVVAGEHVVFAVDVQGVRPRNVWLHFSVDGGKFFAVREFSPGRNLYDPWQVTYPSAQQSMEYYLTGGDAESERYHVEVLPAPTITSISHDLTFKPYTKLEPRKGIEGGTVQALEGTKVTVHAKTNMPAATGTATINLSGANAAQMDVDAQDSTVLTGSFDVPSAEKRGSYTIKFKTTGGQLNPSPVTYDIDSIPDRPPTARFVQPDKPAIKVPANVKVDLVVTGNDDHGVKSANLVVLAGDRPLITKDLLEGQEPKPEFKAVETLDPEKLGLKAGSSVHYRLSVYDNKEPSPNKMETTLQLIEFIEPVSPPEKKKLEDAQKNLERPDPSSTRDEEPSQEQPPQEGSANANEQTNPNPQEVAGKEGGAPGKSNETPTQQPDKGENANEAPGNEKDAGGGENQNQLTPEKEQKIRESLKRLAKNQQKPGKEGNSPSSQPQTGTEPSQSDKQDPSATPNKNDRTQDGASPKSRDAKQPGKLQQSDQTKPQGRPPQEGSDGTDPTNTVKRAEQSDNPGASEPRTKNDQKNAGRQNGERPGQPGAGEPGTNPKSDEVDTPGEPKPGEQPQDKARDAQKQDKDASLPSRKNADSSANPKTGKDDGQRSDTSPDAIGTPDAKENQNTKANPDTKSDTKAKDSPDTKGNPDNKDMRKDAAARQPDQDSSAGKTGESAKDKTDSGEKEKASGRNGQDEATPKADKRGSSTPSEDDRSKTEGAGDKDQVDASSKEKPQSGNDASKKDNAKAAGKTKNSRQQGEAGDAATEDQAGKDATSNGADEKGKPSGRSKPSEKAKGDDRAKSKSGSNDSEKGEQPTKEGEADPDAKSRSGSETDKSDRPKNAASPRQQGDHRNSGANRKNQDEKEKDAAGESAAPDDAKPDTKETTKDGRPAPKGARTQEGEPSSKEAKDHRSERDPDGKERDTEPEKDGNPKAAKDTDDRDQVDRDSRDAADRAKQNPPSKERRQDAKDQSSKMKPKDGVPDEQEGGAPGAKSDNRDQKQTKGEGDAQQSKDDDDASERSPQEKNRQGNETGKPDPSKASDPQKNTPRDSEMNRKTTKQANDERSRDKTAQQRRDTDQTKQEREKESEQDRDRERPKDANEQPDEKKSDPEQKKTDSARPQPKDANAQQKQSDDASSQPKQSEEGQQKQGEEGAQKSSDEGGQKGNSQSQGPGSDSNKGGANSKESSKGSASGKGSESGESSPSGKSQQSDSGGEKGEDGGGKPSSDSAGQQKSGGENSGDSAKGEQSSSGSKQQSKGGDSGSRSSDSSSSAGKQSGDSPGKAGKGGQGQGSQPGQPNSGGVQDSHGGGGAGATSSRKEPAKDESEASPHAKEPDDPGKGLVAPEGAAQTDLALREAHAVLADAEKAKNVEQRDGISRSELEQFIKKYEKPKSAPAGPGREINVKPGEQTPVKPSPNLPGINPSNRFSTRTKTDRGSLPQDDVQNNFEDVRFQPPAEFRSKYEGFKNRLSRVYGPKIAPKATPKKSGQ